MTDVAKTLFEIETGDPSAAEKLLPLVYDELRKLAAARLAREKPGQTLQATALVHEAYLRLVDGDKTSCWNGRAHFFGAASEAMRRITVESARRKKRTKHGGQSKRVEHEPVDVSCTLPDDDLLALDDALDELKAKDPFKAQLIQLRFFAGLTNEEAAAALDVSAATAKRHWRYARAWLHRAIHGANSGNDSRISDPNT